MEASATSRSVEEIVRAVVRAAAGEVEASAGPALADEPDGVHQHRVRVRRLRSVLAGFNECLDAPAAERLRVSYAEWGRELGVVRDIEVRADVAEESLERIGVDDPEIVHRLVDSERDQYTTAHARLVELSRTPRAEEREQLLRAFAADPPVVAPDEDAASVLARVLRKQARRTKKAAKRLDGTDEAHHALRKAARRMRYVAEAIGEAAPELFPDEVAALAEAGDDLHDALGGHRDAVLLADHVRREGVRAGRAGEPTEVYVQIGDRLREEGEEHLEAVPRALAKLKSAASDLP